ncbi:MAG: nitrate reductase subunit alpha, partial [Burkholderiales bacterium]|nr:nitrate reductase subunit alpha [Burkholderiales bacterium]
VENQCRDPSRIQSEGHIQDKITYHELAHRPAKTFTSPDWSGTENDEIPYVAFWQNCRLRLPWRTLTGRQQFYQDHSWMRAFGQAFPQYRPPAYQRALQGFQDLSPNGNKTIMLNFMTAHQKWGIHSSYYDNERMLALSRGGPVVWMNQGDADSAKIVDNDWIECWNSNGAVVARAIVTARLPAGLCIMQHATEKTINTPGSEINHIRGGDHNSPTRVVVNPTHMIGGYAQLSYAFNYYGTICPNRDDFVWMRKMKKVDWMEVEVKQKKKAKDKAKTKAKEKVEATPTKESK